MRMVASIVSIGVIGLLSLPSGVHAQEAPIVLKPMTVEKGFIGKRKKGETKPATDLSGMACMLPSGGRRICLAINDENRSAQFAAIENDRLIPGASIVLFGKDPPKKTVGRQPEPACPQKGEFEDLDGEGVAYAAPYFYVVGSHGCSRHSGEAHLSSFLLARIRVDGEGRPVDRHGGPVTADDPQRAIETTWRVSDLLQSAKTAGAFYAKDLEKQDGLNIEGIAIAGETAWFGLRAPVVAGRAFLVRGTITDLFRDDSHPAKVLETLPVALDGLGVRDLAVLPDGRLLVLGGATHGPEVPFKLFVVDPVTKAVTSVGALPPVTGTVDDKKVIGKAEVVTVLGATPEAASIVVMFDSLLDGAPHQASIRLPK